jgi:hypothetical protein
MDITDLERMAFNYNRSLDFKKIEFEWNGEFGVEFKDANYNFRIELCEFIYPRIEKVNIELIRDCYLEFGKSSEATFNAYLKMYLLGQELLIRGRTKFVMDYLEGASYTADTWATTSGINISKELAEEILVYIEDKIKETTDDKEKILLEKFGKTRFRWRARGR